MTQPQTQPQSSYDASGTGVPTAGRFVWHDIMTTDVAKSVEFYTQLFGWTTQEMDMGAMGTYTMLYTGETGVGGVVPLDAKAGVPSHWIGYAMVSDVDAACARAASLGGKACVPPFDIPGVGRTAVLEDPGGAVISPFTPSSPDAPERAGFPPFGDFAWDELLTTDTDAALKFYTGIFGYDTAGMDMGPMGTYHLFKRGETMTAGMMKMPPSPIGRAGWTPYVHVDDVDAHAEHAQALGGVICLAPHDVPGVGRIAVATDVTGAMFGFMKYDGA
ncbi:MAG: VOC family protein [Gemmatimonadaceae bacterium]